jgi:hypothetical protein
MDAIWLAAVVLFFAVSWLLIRLLTTLQGKEEPWTG